MKILFATSNKGKVANAQAAMGKYGIEVEQVPMELAESRSFDPEVIATEKADQAFRILRQPVMVEDSGFFIRGLGNFPMTHIKFSLQTLGIEKILKMLEKEADRHGEWRMTVAYAFGDGEHKMFTFVEPGEIALSPREVKGPIMSDYWKIYIPKIEPSNELALSEMTDEDLARWKEVYAENNQFRMLAEWLVNSGK